MVSLILLGRTFFTLDKAKTALDALFLTALRWWFQLLISFRGGQPIWYLANAKKILEIVQ